MALPGHFTLCKICPLLPLPFFCPECRGGLFIDSILAYQIKCRSAAITGKHYQPPSSSLCVSANNLLRLCPSFVYLSYFWLPGELLGEMLIGA